jgi:predicted ATPase/DNA-binding SARP family transcriptional activator/Tfp pilus assembly protein PilF
MWTIQLLGGLTVRSEQRIVTRFRTQKAASLLAYLAYHSTPQSRESLIDLLWPEVELEAGRHNLSNALSILRHVLEPPGVPPGSVVLADRFTVQLNSQAVTTDVAALATLLHQAGQVVLDREERLLRLVQASDLYRGRLLPGFYDDWISPHALRLESLFVQALAQLIPELLESERPDFALRFAERAVANDPLSDEATCLLMQTLSALGQPAQALRAYLAFGKRLQKELNSQPSQAMQKMARLLGESVSQQTSSTQPDSDKNNEKAFERLTARLYAEAPQKSSLDTAVRLAIPRRLVGGEFLLRTTTRFFGRQEEVARLNEMLSSPRTRLVTLTGSGGTGKSRLAIEVAAQMVEVRRDDNTEDVPSTAVFVPLADVNEPGRLFDVTLRSLGSIPASDGNLLDQLGQALDSQPNTLLVLDNFEQLAEEGAVCIHELLARSADVKLLVTSRKKLHVEGEHEFRLAPLPTSAGVQTPQALLTVPSIALFVDRCQAVLPDFQLTHRNAAVVSQLCDHLEGIPLSIELAAARVAVLSPAHILEQVRANRLDFLTTRRRDAASRQRTLRATLDWSYHLLPEAAQRALSVLSVFSGGWTLDAAQAICLVTTPETLDLLTLLRDSSMIGVVDSLEGVRFTMLETIRTYASERLDFIGERGEVLRRYRDFFLRLAEGAEPHLTSSAQGVWLERLESEHENLRSALASSLNIDKDTGRSKEESTTILALRFCGALHRFWRYRGYLAEGRAWCEGALQAVGGQERTRARADALNAAGALAWMQGDYPAVRSYHEESLAIRQEIGDRHGIAISLNNLGNLAYYQSDYAAAGACYEESLAIRQQLGEQRGIADSLNNLAIVAHYHGDDVSAHAHYEESLAIRRRLGDRHGIATALNNLGIVAEAQGEYRSARALYEESLAIYEDLGDNYAIATTLNNLGSVAYEQGDYGLAQARLGKSLIIRRELGARQGISSCLNILGLVAQAQHEYGAARAYHEESLTIRREFGDRQRIGTALNNLGSVAKAQHEFAAARAYYKESLAIQQDIGDKVGMVTTLEAFAGLIVAETTTVTVSAASNGIRVDVGDTTQKGAQLWGAAQALRQDMGAPKLPRVHEEDEHSIASARTRLGEGEWEAAWAEGLALTMEQAVELVLQIGQ